MNRTLVTSCALLAVLAAMPAQAGPKVGQWMASVSEKHPEKLQFTMRHGSHDNNGFGMARSAFTGLTDAQIHSATRVPVQFELKREAGTIAFEGTFRSGNGGGEFTFLANPDYPAKLRALGLGPASKHDEDEPFTLTIFDVSTDFIRSMQKIGYSVSLDTYVQFRIFSVDPAYVDAMAKVGFSKLSAEKLVETRIHGATPEYIREMRAAGNDLSLDDYIQSRIFQVTPQFAAEMERAGYANVDHDMLVQFRIHGVTPEFVRELGEVGYTRVPAQKLVEMRIHGVTPEFIRRVEKAGYKKVPIDKLVQMRIFDIDPELVRALDDSKQVD